MAKVGDVITNPIIGERIVFLQTVDGIGGTLLQFDDYPAVGSSGPIEHLHRVQEERLKVRVGEATVLIQEQAHHLTAG